CMADPQSFGMISIGAWAVASPGSRTSITMLCDVVTSAVGESVPLTTPVDVFRLNPAGRSSLVLASAKVSASPSGSEATGATLKEAPLHTSASATIVITGGRFSDILILKEVDAVSPSASSTWMETVNSPGGLVRVPLIKPVDALIPSEAGRPVAL